MYSLLLCAVNLFIFFSAFFFFFFVPVFVVVVLFAACFFCFQIYFWCSISCEHHEKPRAILAGVMFVTISIRHFLWRYFELECVVQRTFFIERQHEEKKLFFHYFSHFRHSTSNFVTKFSIYSFQTTLLLKMKWIVFLLFCNIFIIKFYPSKRTKSQQTVLNRIDPNFIRNQNEEEKKHFQNSLSSSGNEIFPAFSMFLNWE